MAIERFLILDDNAANTLFLEMILKDLGISKVFKSPTGADALIQADKNHIQFYIVAWELKGMPGTLFIQKMRSKRKRQFVPCILYSKRMSPEDVQLTKELGFPHILSMPFDKEQVRNLISSILNYEASLDPKEATLRKVETYHLEGQPMEAYKFFNDKLFEPGPFRVRGLIAAAEVMMALSKLDKAERCLTDALIDEPENNKALQLQAKIMTRHGKHEEAISLLERLVLTSPKNLSNKIHLGSAFIEADRHDEARKVLNEVLEVDAEHQDCKDQMGTLAFKEGDFTLAEQLIAETENGNELARAFNNLAISQVAKGNFDSGIATYNNAMRMLADKARLYLLQYNLGLAYRRKGELEKSLKELAKSYVSAPSFEKAYVAIARIVQELKEKGTSPDTSLIQEIKAAREKTKKIA